MSISPARFVVRDESFGQNTEYPYACSELTQLLLARYDGPYLLDIIDTVSKTLKNNRASFLRPEFAGIHPDYGNKRPFYMEDTYSEGNAGLTKFDRAYKPRYDRFLAECRSKIKQGDERFAKNVVSFTIKAKDNSEIELSAIWKQIDQLEYPIKNRRKLHNEIVRHSFTALSGDVSTQERKVALHLAYDLLSHFCPLEAGSGTLAIVYREFLATLADLPTYNTKPKINSNLEALLTPPEDFIRRAVTGKYSDAKTSDREILTWQRRTARHQEKHLGIT